jgi:hypothetical protein
VPPICPAPINAILLRAIVEKSLMQTRPAAAVINLFRLRIQAAAEDGSHRRNQMNCPDFHPRAEAAFGRIE